MKLKQGYMKIIRNITLLHKVEYRKSIFQFT